MWVTYDLNMVGLDVGNTVLILIHSSGGAEDHKCSRRLYFWLEKSTYMDLYFSAIYAPQRQQWKTMSVCYIWEN